MSEMEYHYAPGGGSIVLLQQGKNTHTQTLWTHMHTRTASVWTHTHTHTHRSMATPPPVYTTH